MAHIECDAALRRCAIRVRDMPEDRAAQAHDTYDLPAGPDFRAAARWTLALLYRRLGWLRCPGRSLDFAVLGHLPPNACDKNLILPEPTCRSNLLQWKLGGGFAKPVFSVGWGTG